MTTHLRRQILAQVVTYVTGLPTTGSNVWRSRVYPLQRAELPALLVRYALNTEDANVRTMPAPRVFERLCRIEVVPVVRMTDDYDITLDQICLEVEKALAMPATGPWQSLTYRRTDFELTGSGEQPLGQAPMTYEAIYLARENAPDVAP